MSVRDPTLRWPSATWLQKLAREEPVGPLQASVRSTITICERALQEWRTRRAQVTGDCAVTLFRLWTQPHSTQVQLRARAFIRRQPCDRGVEGGGVLLFLVAWKPRHSHPIESLVAIGCGVQLVPFKGSGFRNTFT